MATMRPTSANSLAARLIIDPTQPNHQHPLYRHLQLAAEPAAHFASGAMHDLQSRSSLYTLPSVRAISHFRASASPRRLASAEARHVPPPPT